MTTPKEASPSGDPAAARASIIGEALSSLESGLQGETIQACEKALVMEPGCPEAIFLLGLVAFDLEDPLGSIKLLEHAHASDETVQEYAEALAAIYVQLGKVNEGLFYAKLATALSPHPTIRGLLPDRFGSFFKNLDRSSPYYYRDRAALKLGRGLFEDSAADCQRQLDLLPGDVDSLRLLAQARLQLGEFESALAAIHATLHSGPPEALDLSLTANILARSGRLEESLVCHRAALALAPKEAGIQSRRLADLLNDPKISGKTLAEEHRDWAKQHAKAQPGVKPPKPAKRDDQAELRIGYLCGSFHEGDLMSLLEPVLRHHDRNTVEIYCYSEGARHDVTTEGLMRLANRWTDTSGIDDRTLAHILRGDEIDIAVDLSGHHEGGRAALFAFKPAPVTLTWLGYDHPLAIAGHGYLSDRLAWPAEQTPKKDQKAPAASNPIHRLAERPCFALDRPGLLPEVGPLPASLTGHVTFGVSCDLGQIGPGLAATWSCALQAVENSRLLICNRFNQDRETIERCLSLFSHLGLRSRVDVINMADNFSSPFAFYNHVDIALDTGHGSSLVENGRALWMGVPFLSLAGDRHGNRLGASLLHHAGHPEWVATDEIQLSKIAKELSDDKERLADLRQNLRAAFAETPAADPAGLAGDLEQLYRSLLKAAA